MYQVLLKKENKTLDSYFSLFILHYFLVLIPSIYVYRVYVYASYLEVAALYREPPLEFMYSRAPKGAVSIILAP